MRMLVMLLTAIAGLSACERDVTSSESRIRGRRAAVERPELWSVRAVGQPSATFRICANQDIRAGFIRPTPSLGAQTCRRVGEPVRTTHGWAFRCSFGEDTYAVSSAAIGDLTHAFQTEISITPLQGRGQGLHQTLRYQRLGACPAGWEIGQALGDRRPGLHKAIAPVDEEPTP